MIYVEWSKEMETGFEVIDDQHKIIVKMMNEIAAALEGAESIDPNATIEFSLRELLNYTIFHFDLEESLMTESGYQGLAEHKQIHSEFRSRIQDLFARFLEGEDVAFQLLKELRAWLVNHIQGTDMKLVAYLRRDR